MKNKIVIANMMRCKNKQSFFALHQIQEKILNNDSSIDVEFHILWDSDDNNLEKKDDIYWANLIDSYIHNIHSYSRDFFKEYVIQMYGIDDVDKFDEWIPIYHILMAHYLRRVKMFDYYLIYDDDVLINDNFENVTELLKKKIPVLISEPMNYNCDKVLLNKLFQLYGENFFNRYKNRNPKYHGFNAGFQGIDLSIYDDFLSVDRFGELINLFDIRNFFDDNGNEIWGTERFLLDTQQQSFFSLMNVVLSKKEIHILDPNQYYVLPNWGTHPVHGEINPNDELQGWGLCLSSKISHFIGHTHGKGKPKVFLEKVDEYLISKNIKI